MRGITRRFPCVVANDRIDLDEKAREIGPLKVAKAAPETFLRGGTSC